MKTVEVTRSKEVSKPGSKPSSPMCVFVQILREKGIRGVYKGVNAVALRQITGWSSRIGISRFAEEIIRGITGKSKEDKLRFGERILASTIGGALSCWNQPFEVAWSTVYLILQWIDLCVGSPGGNAIHKKWSNAPCTPNHGLVIHAHYQNVWHQGYLPRDCASNWGGSMGHYLYGRIWWHCKGAIVTTLIEVGRATISFVAGIVWKFIMFITPLGIVQRSTELQGWFFDYHSDFLCPLVETNNALHDAYYSYCNWFAISQTLLWSLVSGLSTT